MIIRHCRLCKKATRFKCPSASREYCSRKCANTDQQIQKRKNNKKPIKKIEINI